MSALKEEWANIMNSRESAPDNLKNDQIKSRIFNNFYSALKGQNKALPEISEVEAPDLKNLKQKLQKTLFSFQRTKAPDVATSFEFGLRTNVPILPVQTSEVIDRTKEIWKIEEYPHKAMHEDIVPDRFDVYSIAENIGETKPWQHRIFNDISPISRYMSNMTIEEEEIYLKESKKHEKHIHGYIHLLHQELVPSQLDKIDWGIAVKLLGGFIFKYEVNSVLNPKELEKNPVRGLEISKDESSQYTSNLLENTSKQIGKNIEETDELELEMISMMESLKFDGKSSEGKLQKLLEIVENKLRTSKDAANNMQIRVLYQFLVEYKKAKEVEEPEKKLQRDGKRARTGQKQRKPTFTNVSSRSSVTSSKK